MTGNRDNPAETGKAQLSALETAQRWLASEGGSSRNVEALSALLETTRIALARGDEPPRKESTDLAAAADLIRRRPAAADARVRGRDLERWWAARRTRIEAKCREEGCEWVPDLVAEQGGGRGNPTRLRLHFHPVDPNDEVAPTLGHVPHQSGEIAYRIDPATPALWLRVIIGNKPFAIRSLRGYMLLLTIAMDWLLIGAMWYFIWKDWLTPRPLLASDLAISMLAGLVTWGLLAISKPLRQLVRQRIAVANDGMLGFNTYHAQLRMQHEEPGRLGSRTFSFVRHWATCPICAAEVDLADGGRAFPDRIVGRCHDAPLEHVFSFDPVTLQGHDFHTGQGA